MEITEQVNEVAQAECEQVASDKYNLTMTTKNGNTLQNSTFYKSQLYPGTKHTPDNLSDNCQVSKKKKYTYRKMQILLGSFLHSKHASYFDCTVNGQIKLYQNLVRASFVSYHVKHTSFPSYQVYTHTGT